MNEVQRFRKKPVEVEMMLWDGTDEAVTAIKGWVGFVEGGGWAPVFYAPGESDRADALLYVAHNGDWCTLPVGYRVARELDGSGFYPLSPEGFTTGYVIEGQ